MRCVYEMEIRVLRERCSLHGAWTEQAAGDTGQFGILNWMRWTLQYIMIQCELNWWHSWLHQGEARSRSSIGKIDIQIQWNELLCMCSYFIRTLRLGPLIGLSNTISWELRGFSVSRKYMYTLRANFGALFEEGVEFWKKASIPLGSKNFPTEKMKLVNSVIQVLERTAGVLGVKRRKGVERRKS